MRIVVTGIGIITSLGGDRESVWAALTAGRSGLEPGASPWKEFNRLPVGLADLGRALEDLPAGSGQWQPSRASLMATIAIEEAWTQSRLDVARLDTDRVGVYFGSCMGGAALAATNASGVSDRPLDPAGHAMQALADQAAAVLAVTGPRLVVNTACAAGATAIGVAVEQLRGGHVDVAVAGGAEELSPLAMAGFSSVGAADRQLCSPYGRSRGLNIGEAAAFLILERLDESDPRHADCLAELLGYGLSSDAYHATAPDPEARGAELAIRRALEQAGLQPTDVDHINGHGTGTAANDRMELALFDRLFTRPSRPLLVSSTKGATGHAFAGTAAMEVAFSVLASQRACAPPTLGAPLPSPAVQIEGQAVEAPIAVALSTSYAFGGNNACVAVGTPRSRGPARPAPVDDVVVTGIGAIGAPGYGRAAWWDCLARGEPVYHEVEVDLGEGGDDTIPVLLADTPAVERDDTFASRRQWRRMDLLAQRCVMATRAALDDAELEAYEGREDIALVVGTESGSIDSAKGFEMTVSPSGSGGPADVTPVNPVLFANTVMSSTAGHLSLRFGWRGPTATIVSGWTSSVNALLFATDSIRSGAAPTAVVVCGDLITSEVLVNLRAHGLMGATSTMPVASAAVAFVLESRRTAEQRGRVPWATILGGASLGPARPAAGLADDPTLWRRTMENAVRHARVDRDHIDLVVRAANGISTMDDAESAAIDATWGPAVRRVAPKRWLGESRGASGAVGLLAAARALAETDGPQRALVNTGSRGGSCASLVVGRVVL